MAPRSPGRCVFCGSQEELTIEDAIPKGIARLFRTEGTRRWGTTGLGREMKRVGGGVIFKVRDAVCRPCNTGWMSGLQRTTQPLLKEFVSAERQIRLDPSVQNALAAWMTMTAMVMEWADDEGPPVFYSQEERESFHETKTVPARTLVWLGAREELVDPSAVAFISSYVRISEEPMAPEEPHNGIAFSVILGHAVIQLLYLREPTRVRIPLFTQHVDRVWRGKVIGIPRSYVVPWPPPITLTRAEVRQFTTRWRRSGGPSD